ncbi:MAG: nicotinamide riboside transporter PnuC [Chitinophagaceae bacterium]|nr:MAG: nicotinamide riboside transporter PnuC [Chitinophagaceae bacterium]
MDLAEIGRQFIAGIQQTGWLEAIAVISGIASVWFSKKENILVYPVGLVNTIFYTYLSFNSHLIGEAGVNLYYTVVSLWGWYLWSSKDTHKRPLLHISFSTQKQVAFQAAFFLLLYATIFLLLTYLKKVFAPGAIPWADALASASAFTGMYLMAKKKVESWYWWIITNIASIPLYFVKGFVFTSVYYLVLLVLAVSGLQSWKNKARYGRP